MIDKSNHISEGIHMFHTTHLSRRVYTLHIYLQHTLIDSGGQRKSKIYASFWRSLFIERWGEKFLTQSKKWHLSVWKKGHRNIKGVTVIIRSQWVNFNEIDEFPLTLSQWSSSGNPVAIQCTWNLDPNVHWNATGERIVGSQCASSGLPVASQWSSSVFQLCKLTLDRHWDTTGC